MQKVEQDQPYIPCQHSWQPEYLRLDTSTAYHVRCRNCQLEALCIKGHIYKTLRQLELGVKEP